MASSSSAPPAVTNPAGLPGFSITDPLTGQAIDPTAVAPNNNPINQTSTSTSTNSNTTLPSVSAPPTLDPTLANQTLIFDTAASSPTNTTQNVPGSQNRDLGRLNDLINLYEEFSSGKVGNVNQKVGADLEKQTGLYLGSGTDPQVRQEILGSILSTIGIGGNRSYGNVSASDFTTADRKKIQTQLLKDIYSHVGLDPNSVNSKSLPTAKQLDQMEIPAGITDRMANEGFNVDYTSGQPVTFGDVKKTLAKGSAIKPKTVTQSSPGQPAQSTPMTAAQIYAQFTKEYSDPKNQQFRQLQVQALEQAGLLASTSKTPQDSAVYSAYISLLSQASQANQPVNAYLNTLISNNQNPLETETETVGPLGSSLLGIANQMGVHLTDDQATYLAQQATAQNWTTPQMRMAVAGMYTYDPNNQTGLAAQIANGIQTVAGDYQIPVSNDAIGNFIKTALQNGNFESSYQAAAEAQASYEQYAKQIAQGLYPQWAQQIEQGINVKTLMDPYLQVAQQTLGVNANQISLTNPDGSQNGLYTRFLQGTTDPKTGVSSPMTLDQWKRQIMTDPQYGYQYTDAARQQAASISQAILSLFGKVPDSGGSFGGFGYSTSTSMMPS